MDEPTPGEPPVRAAALPRRLADWPPFLWSRVLFPGRGAPDAGPWRWGPLLALLVLPAALLYPSLGFHLFEPDESRYAEIPREMLARGDFVVPYLQGEPYLDKPPLFYWLVAASYTLLGTSAAAARLVPALALHGSVLVTYLFGRRALGQRAAFWGALGLTLAPGFLSVGRLLILDGLLAFWVTLALFTAFEAVRGGGLCRRWWLVSAAACGLGVLTKGPVALVLVAPPVWLHRRLTGAARPLPRGAVLGYAAVVLAVALPWYVAVCVRIPEFAQIFFWEHNILRFLAPYAHEHGVWFYGPVLLAGLLPGSLLAVPFCRFLASPDPAAAARRTAGLGFLLLAGGWCVLFFTLSACKLPTYVLPAFPPLALALGAFFAHSRWHGSRAATAVVVASFAVLAVGHHAALPWYAGYRSPVARSDDLYRLCGDPRTPVVCYPRNCDSVSFLLGRDDLRSYRSKDIEDLRALVRRQPRTVILCTHRHSLRGLKQLLPPEVWVAEEVNRKLRPIRGVPPSAMKVLAKLMGETALGLCDVAVVERRPPGMPLPAPGAPAEPAPDPLELSEDGS
jgi:hypothetical protein